MIFILIIAYPAISQEEKWEKPAGSIENAQIVIEKDKIINLRPVSRRFKSIQIEVPKPQKLQFNYSLKPTLDTLSTLQVIVRPKTMRDQPLEKFYGLSTKLGYGNYRSPYVLINAGNKRSDEFMYNAQLNHLSSAKGAVNDAPYYFTRLGFDGKFFLNTVNLLAGISYQNQSYMLYGYDPNEYQSIVNKDILDQRLNNFNLYLGLEDNNLKNSSDQSFILSINLLSHNHLDQELLLDASYDLSWKMADDWYLRMPVQYSYIAQNETASRSLARHYLGLKPAIDYTWHSFIFTVGANGYFQQDPADQSESKIFVYPNLGITYDVNKDHALGLRLDGEVEQVTQRSLFADNLYLDSLQLASNNIRDFGVEVSVKGKISETFGYNLGYNFDHYKRMMFFDNNPLDTARFLVVYDNSGVTRQRFFTDFTYVKNENLDFKLGGRYNIYSTSDLPEAWHKPVFELHFGSGITVMEKLYINLTYNLLSGIKAQNSNAEVITLDLINDLNLTLDLDITERAGLFLNFRNILGQNYQVYNNYPVNGLQVLGGFSIRF